MGEYPSLLFRQKQQKQEMMSIAMPKPTNHRMAKKKRGTAVYATDCTTRRNVREHYTAKNGTFV